MNNWQMQTAPLCLIEDYDTMKRALEQIANHFLTGDEARDVALAALKAVKKAAGWPVKGEHSGRTE